MPADELLHFGVKGMRWGVRKEQRFQETASADAKAAKEQKAEAKDLQSLSEEFAEKGVQFIGVNVRDTAATSAAFGRNFGITYPSIIDAGTGEVVLAFTGVVSPQAVPTTLVIDRKGRVASRILGRIEKGTLKALIDTVVNEK